MWMAICFGGNALCCVVILATTYVKRRAYVTVRPPKNLRR